MPTQITPEMMAKSGSEDGHQMAIILWASLNKNKYPDLKWLYHVPNGGSRHKAEAAKLKAMGMKSGVPDLHLPVRRGSYSGLIIELKVGKGVTSDFQDEWIAHFIRQAYRVEVCYGWEAAVKVIEEYLNV